jgi:hypothetical protein
MAAEVRWLLAFSAIILAFANGYDGTTPHRRFEYKYSFKPPYLAQKDGSVPFWQYGGSEFYCRSHEPAAQLDLDPRVLLSLCSAVSSKYLLIWHLNLISHHLHQKSMIASIISFRLEDECVEK